MRDLQHSPGAFPNVSVRWLLAAAGIALLGALFCAWLTLCLLYWQGSWQLLYQPKPAITRTPASVGTGFEPVHFAATETGTTRLTGWWIPNQNSRFTVLYLHGSDGNLSDSVDTLAALHRQSLAVFAIDYRGYGQSQRMYDTGHDAGHPSEKKLRQDAEWALTWLTLTRNIPAKSIVVFGSGLGANLAAELAADHSELAGVILDQPIQNPMAAVFNDSRSRLVPAHWLVRDRFDLNAASASLRLPSLWLIAEPQNQTPAAYQAVPERKTAVWLNPPTTADSHFSEAVQRWLDDIQDQSTR